MTALLEESTRPNGSPTGGIRTSSTKKVTILPKAAPMTKVDHIAPERQFLALFPHLDPLS